MLGICLPETNVSGLPQNSFTKPIVLKPGETLKICKTDTETLYFIKSENGLRHIPEPVYRVGETYYVKESYCKIDGIYRYWADAPKSKIYPITKSSIWINKATMPQAAARSYIRITKCEVICEVDEPFGYRYEYTSEL